MKNFKCLILIFTVTILACASNTDKIQVDGLSFDAFDPPGTIKVGDNFYVDECEISNIDFKEYNFWMKQIHGATSEEYKNSLPDTSVWLNVPGYGEMMDIYFQHPSYDTYPVVGVTYEQVKSYMEWRTERVLEMILVIRKKILAQPGNKDTHFTLKRYCEGDFDWIIKREDVLYPKYDLPDQEEWERFAKGNSDFKFGTDNLSKHNKKVLKKLGRLYNLKTNTSVKADGELPKITDPQYAYGKNINGLYHVIGNVSEMIDKPGVAKGGSWMDLENKVSIEKNIKFEQPNCWTGFRGISKFELAKVKK